MRMRKETKYGFDSAEHRTGIHKIDQQTRFLARAERGSLTGTESAAIVLNTSMKDIHEMAQRVVTRARSTLGGKLQ